MIPKLIHLKFELAGRGTVIATCLGVVGLVAVCLAAIDPETAKAWITTAGGPWANFTIGTMP